MAITEVHCNTLDEAQVMLARMGYQFVNFRERQDTWHYCRGIKTADIQRTCKNPLNYIIHIGGDNGDKNQH